VSATGLRKGALPRPHNLVLPKLEDYVSKDLLATAPMPPANGNVDRQSKVTNGWPMYMNGPDPNAPEVIQQAGGIGDCTCAGMGHAVSQWTAYSGKVAGGAEFTDATILTMYEAVSGYVLGNESTDNGAALYQVCNYMMNTGIKDTKGNLHKIEGYADISLFNNIGWIKGVLNCFGTVYTGISADQNFANAWSAGTVASLPSEGTNVGPYGIDHCVVMSQSNYMGGGADHIQTFISWGAEVEAEDNWVRTNVGEAIAIITTDWVEANGDSPLGQAVSELLAELKSLPESSVNPSNT
jgi:hypothetical protein